MLKQFKDNCRVRVCADVRAFDELALLLFDMYCHLHVLLIACYVLSLLCFVALPNFT